MYLGNYSIGSFAALRRDQWVLQAARHSAQCGNLFSAAVAEVQEQPAPRKHYVENRTVENYAGMLREEYYCEKWKMRQSALRYPRVAS
ncbi:hypothetical protein O3P69_010013 [Scylla paramamosain]|uniref:Uncharacterized protein n=1 Tax=Scylla paramamosain TaxID=85552 RepID=A0AAW0SN79_SCYPA